jgi:predicted nucleotidyltransferase
MDLKYFESGAKVTGVWGIGSGAAGRWATNSDIDIWICVEGLTKLGEKYADQAVIELMELENVRCYAGGRLRKIDVVIMSTKPSIEWPTVLLSYNHT